MLPGIVPSTEAHKMLGVGSGVRVAPSLDPTKGKQNTPSGVNILT